jgi:hypothetical protein
MILVDEELHHLAPSTNWARPPSFENALTENIVTGCTAAMNLPALKLVVRCSDLSQIYFHDWWIYLVLSAFGSVKYDEEPTILYRQHESNVIGMGTGLRRYINILHFLRRHSWVRIMYNQIVIFHETYGACLNSKQHVLLSRYFLPVSGVTRLRLIFSKQRFRQSLVSEALFRLLLIFEKVLHFNRG